MKKKNLLEKKQEILMTNDGFLVSRYFGMPLTFKREYNKTLSI